MKKIKNLISFIAICIISTFILSSCTMPSVDGIVANIIDAAVEDIDPTDLNSGADRLPDNGFEVSASNIRNLNVQMINSNVNIENHSSSHVRIVFVPPDRGHFVTPDVRHVAETLEIIEYYTLSRDINTGTGQLRIYLPQQADFSSSNIQTINGAIDASYFNSGNLVLSTVNGSVILSQSQIADQLNISTVNGSITLNNVDADMEAASLTTVLGRITIN